MTMKQASDLLIIVITGRIGWHDVLLPNNYLVLQFSKVSFEKMIWKIAFTVKPILNWVFWTLNPLALFLGKEGTNVH